MTYVLFVPENIHFILLWSFKFILCDCQLKKILHLAALQQRGSFLRPRTINCIICPRGALHYRNENSFSDSLHCLAHSSVAVGSGRGEGREAALAQRTHCCEDRGWVSQPVAAGSTVLQEPRARVAGGKHLCHDRPALLSQSAQLCWTCACGEELCLGLEARSSSRLGVPSVGGRRQANKWESISLVVSLEFVILFSVIAG